MERRKINVVPHEINTVQSGINKETRPVLGRGQNMVCINAD